MAGACGRGAHWSAGSFGGASSPLMRGRRWRRFAFASAVMAPTAPYSAFESP